MKSKKPNQGQSDLPPPGVDLAEVERLLAFMNEHGLDEFEYEREGLRIRLKKATAYSTPAPSPVYRPADAAFASPGAAPLGQPAVSPTSEGAAEAAVAEGLHVIKSPIVGTFYAGPSPEAEPFVKVGDQVAAGQVLCIIEAMKLMNEIESDLAGELVRVLAQTGQPVEYGEPLFAIRPAQKN